MQPNMLDTITSVSGSEESLKDSEI